MPGARSWFEAPQVRGESPGADESPGPDEQALLDRHLQRQLEQDVGSDAYTECDIEQQERELLKYLDDKANVSRLSKEDDDYELFRTPKCWTPNILEPNRNTVITPGSERTTEYFSLSSIEDHLLENELVEQDALLNAFQTINYTDTNTATLPLVTSISSQKSVEHSIGDIIRKEILNTGNENVIFDLDRNFHSNETHDRRKRTQEQVYSPDSLIDEEPSTSSDYVSAYPLSSAVSCCGGFAQLNISSNSSFKMDDKSFIDSGLEQSDEVCKGLSNHKDLTRTDVSLTESPLQNFTWDDTHYPTNSSNTDKNKPCASHQSSVNTGSGASSGDYNIIKCTGSDSTKEKKQRQNEEIHVTESSLSSETGSWESVFPPRRVEREIGQGFLNRERQQTSGAGAIGVEQETQTPVQKFKFISPFVKTTACFIDASSLMDDTEENTIKIWPSCRSQLVSTQIVEPPSQPLLCSRAKSDTSPGDKSEENDNDDSLERTDNDNKDTDSIQNDLSPTIFDMTPITDDSYSTNAFVAGIAAAAHAEENRINMGIEEKKKTEKDTNRSSEREERSLNFTQEFVLATTPHNSILTIKTSAMKPYESDESVNTLVNKESNFAKSKKYNESSPIVSGGASIEDHLPIVGSVSASPLIRRKIENKPIVSGAYIPDVELNNLRKVRKPNLSCAPAWVVDMSSSEEGDVKKSPAAIKKPVDKQCDTLKTESKHHNFENSNSKGSVESDSSDKSSHKFYIDLSSLPDQMPPKKNKESEAKEKKTIFSMYIGLNENSSVKKELPARLNPSRNTRKNVGPETRSTSTVEEASAASAQYSLPKNEKQGACVFEAYESLCDDTNIPLSDIFKLPEQKSMEPEDIQPLHLNKLRREIREIEEEMQVNCSRFPAPGLEDPFVRLSDLDKPVQLPMRNAATENRMTRSIPDDDWRNSSAAGSRSGDVISSFHSENAMSLNRLFPHLRNEFSRSMPGSLSSRNRSPVRPAAGSPAFSEDQYQGDHSDTSEQSSAQSSMCPSMAGYSTTDENSQTSSLKGNCESRLGQDLLRMFLEEIAPDVVVEVGGRRIKAHKCILSSRCQYFAGILSGGWVESAGNVIVLPPRFSYNVVHFALCHIYSGASSIPDNISILELATLADMLGLEGLKEAIMFTLKAKYCHNFHQPCTVCIAGVLECFPLTSIYGLDELYHRCLKWITKHFTSVWPTKAFATLPKDLIEKCYQQLVNSLTVDNIADIVIGMALAASYVEKSGRWAETVVRLYRRVLYAAATFAAPRLLLVLMQLGGGRPEPPEPGLRAMRICIITAMRAASPTSVCHAYNFLHIYVTDLQQSKLARPDILRSQKQSPPPTDLLEVCAASWLMEMEGVLVRAAPRVVNCPAFQDLTPEQRRRLRELGCIRYEAPPASPPVRDRRASNAAPRPSAARPSARTADIDRVRASFVPYAQKPTATRGGYKDPPPTYESIVNKNCDQNNLKIRTTKAQIERTKFNLSKNTPSQERLNTKGSHPYESTKPRYLEPRVPKDSPKKVSGPVGRRLVASSSESSRNSSPVLARARTSRAASGGGRAVADGSRAVADGGQAVADGGWAADGGRRAIASGGRAALAHTSRPGTAEPSTDSCSDSQASNKYATYTKSRNTDAQSQPVNTQASLGAIKKTNTKIPVYNQGSKTGQQAKEKRRHNQSMYASAGEDSPSSCCRNKRVLSSVMSATKSSSAKMVPKVTTENMSRTPKRAEQQGTRGRPDRAPIMERSGTFLKDEPTFRDYATHFDMDTETD